MRNIQKKTSVLCSIDDQIASKLLPTKQVTVNEYHTGIAKNNSCLNSTKGRVSHSGGGGGGKPPRKSIINNNLKSS